FQCVTNPQEKWVIHGLWPQNKKARHVKQHPRFCQGDLPPINEKIMQPYLKNSPGYSLLQAEWEKHGSCAFKTPETYFQKQEELFTLLILPHKAMKPKQLRKIIKENNPKLKNVRFYTSKNEIKICYDLNWKYINCPN
ncbi:MAG: hypothetical protein N4Q30_04525, partial [Neisseriaceae bacterium]|nr:hypothetical protein [Neisseriaceae bacterium]